MSQVSQAEAVDMLSKLLSERTPVQAFFFSSTGTRISLFGFVDSFTRDSGVVVSVSGPPIDLARAYVNFLPFDNECEFWYGEQRELPPDSRPLERRGESCLLFKLPHSSEQVGLFFTV